jgi:hypothetical protein
MHPQGELGSFPPWALRSAYSGDGEGDDGSGRERLMRAKGGKGNRKGLVVARGTLGYALIPRWKANRRVRRKGRNSFRIQCSYLTAPSKPAYKDTCPLPIPQPSRHAAHYRTVLAPLLKRCAPTSRKGDLQTNISRRMNDGLRARYKPRGIESWPWTRVRQLPSSKQSQG